MQIVEWNNYIDIKSWFDSTNTDLMVVTYGITELFFYSRMLTDVQNKQIIHSKNCVITNDLEEII